MTFSIAARCKTTGQLGIAISSSSIAVGARCPWLRAGIGAVATQNVTLPSLGPRILDLMERGEDPAAALKSACAEDAYQAYRQVAVLDRRGRAAMFTGAQALGLHRAVAGEQCVAAGNMLAAREVIDAMVHILEAGTGALADRLLAALQAGLDAGGETGPVHSAALKVVDQVEWPIVDLRVDWADADPLRQLGQLWTAFEPQMADYLRRALDPTAAPSYGVPGDE